MSTNDSPDIDSTDRSSSAVESLLKQMPLRCPSEQLDARIASLHLADHSDLARSEHRRFDVAASNRFGWNAIFATAVSALVAGILLGYSLVPAWELFARSDGALGRVFEESTTESSLLTPVTFNVPAFNLLHGHSQQVEFENCDQCHQPETAKDGLKEVLEAWFYGDEDFFEAHPAGIADCSNCHKLLPAEHAADPKDGNHEFGRLVNCSDCHKLEADGFGGFKKDLHSTTKSSEG